MFDIIGDLEHIKNSIKNRKKIAFCCIIFDDKEKRIDRLYSLTHGLPANILLGEIELWKMDIRDNMVFSKNELDSYTRRQGEIDGG